MAAPTLIDQASNQVLRGIKALFKRVQAGHVGQHDALLFGRMEDVILRLLDHALENPNGNSKFESDNSRGNANRPTSIQIGGIGRDPLRIVSPQ